MSFACSPHKGSLTGLVLESRLQRVKETHKGDIPIAGCEHESGLAAPIFHLGLVSQKQLCGL
eukprot:XP_001705877.1 Hypothetical protein GL50803_37818 [Giardia lamblia ATCC 50803]